MAFVSARSLSIESRAAHHADPSLLKGRQHGSIRRFDGALDHDARLARAVADEGAFRATARVHFPEHALDDERVGRRGVAGQDRDLGERPHRLQLRHELVGENPRSERQHFRGLFLLLALRDVGLRGREGRMTTVFVDGSFAANSFASSSRPSFTVWTGEP